MVLNIRQEFGKSVDWPLGKSQPPTLRHELELNHRLPPAQGAFTKDFSESPRLSVSPLWCVDFSEHPAKLRISSKRAEKSRRDAACQKTVEESAGSEGYWAANVVKPHKAILGLPRQLSRRACGRSIVMSSKRTSGQLHAIWPKSPMRSSVLLQMTFLESLSPVPFALGRSLRRSTPLLAVRCGTWGRAP